MKYLLHGRGIKTKEKAELANLQKGINFYYSSHGLGAIHPFLHIVPVHFHILYFKSSWDKIASTARNWINSAPQAAATTFAFSFVFVLLLVFTGMKSLGKAGACSVGDLQNCCCQETAKWYLLKRKIKIIMLNFHKYIQSC